MGYLLKEALKTLCGLNQWCYAVFWKIGDQNPKLLTWEECYYELISYSGLQHFSGFENPELAFGELEALWADAEPCASQLLAQVGDKVHTLVNRMMMKNHVYVLGEGLVGRAAFTGNHHWILSENYNIGAHPPEVLTEVYQQFSAGMQTVAVIPVLPYGVFQLGSSLMIKENMNFVNDVKTLVFQLGCVPGVLLSDSCVMKDAFPMTGVPVSLGNSVCMVSSGRCGVTTVSDSFNQQLNSTPCLTHTNQSYYSLNGQIQDCLQFSSLTFQAPNGQKISKTHIDHYEAKVLASNSKVPSINQLEDGVTKAEVVHGNSVEGLNQEAALHNLSGFNPQSGVGLSAASNGNLGLKHQILSDAGVQNYICNSPKMSDGLIMSQPRTNGGLLSGSHKDSVSSPPVHMSEICNGIDGYLRSMANVCSLSDVPANDNIFCTRVAGPELQDVCSSKTVVSKSEVQDHLTTSHLLFSGSDGVHHSADEKCTQIEMAESKETAENDLLQACGILLPESDKQLGLTEHVTGSIHANQKHNYGRQNLGMQNAIYDDDCVQLPLGDDLFDIVGADFKNKLLNDSCNTFVNNRFGTNACNLGKYNSTSMKVQGAASDLYSANEGNSSSGIFSMTGADHLLDAIVSRTHPTAKQSLDVSISCGSMLTNASSSSVCNVMPSNGLVGVPDQLQGDLFGLPDSMLKAEVVGSCSLRSGSCKENARSHSQSSSIYGSQISLWGERGQDVKQNSSVSTAYSKKTDGVSKSNRKRLKPGENPRPRPKDRQMIQDRVKELREIVPNGAKCSIDALLERTIKQMLFLRSVTKHADKLKQTGEMKIVSKGDGILLKDNFEGGATWAYEVGSQSMVCPIIVEDLNPPRQMLVEMLCEERGLFLEIADIIRGLGLTILKGIMETRNDKVWARFAVEADRDVTRMEIFVPLVHLFDQTLKGGAGSANSFVNDKVAVQFHQIATVPATGGHCSL